jgi:hypothetical protein
MLKYIQIVIFSFAPMFSIGQFVDNFTDGDFTSNPEWTGDAAKFIVNGSQQLQLNAPAETSDAYLSTASGAIEDASWEFYLRMDFNPSSTNYARIYLVSNSPDLRGGLNGYFVYVGGTTDEISLYRQTGTTRTRILQGLAGSVNSTTVNVKIRVTRDEIGNWELLRDTSLTGVFVSEGAVFDNTHFQSSFFGVYCDYTATRSTHFRYDEFLVAGDPYIDATPPGLVSVTPISSNELQVLFNEPVSLTTAENTTNYAVNNGIGQPASAVRDGTNTAQVTLTFPTNFIDGSIHTLTMTGMTDLSGNIAPQLVGQFFYWEDNVPVPGDVRINEVMPKESPSVGMPLNEWVELYNPTSKTFNITGWRLCNDNSCGTIQNHLLLPDSYVIIVPTNSLDSFPGLNVINATSFPSLKNTGDEVSIRTSDESIQVDWMKYNDATFQDLAKSQGGYSLELINPYLPCANESNWRATNSSFGGTPGAQNSVFSMTPDTVTPSISQILVLSEYQLRVTFTEPLDSSNMISLTPLFTPNLTVVALSSSSGISSELTITVQESIGSGIWYTLNLGEVIDCSGNGAILQGQFIRPQEAMVGDIVINEILFNPLTGGVDYIELYNTSEKTLSFEQMKIANVSGSSIANPELISNFQTLFPPNSYVVLTSDSLNVKQNYSNHGWGTFLAVTLPSYSNSTGTVILLSPSDSILDSVSYDENWHFRLIDDKKGKSLERISPLGPSNDPSNWQTASETVGFGTPGLSNSQYFLTGSEGTISIEPKIFSPDNDGYQDFCLFIYDLPETGMVGSIFIFDEHGRQVREFVNNHYFDQRGELKWDGIRDDGTKCSVGRYIIVFDIFSPQTGTKIAHKQVIVVAARI